jgi:hypothetical protein
MLVLEPTGARPFGGGAQLTPLLAPAARPPAALHRHAQDDRQSCRYHAASIARSTLMSRRPPATLSVAGGFSVTPEH